jgi:nucleotide-binding universal stress UspA family protein
MIHNILVPLDGSPVSEAALPYAVALAGRTGAKLTLMRAAHTAPFVVDKGPAQLGVVSEAEAYLDLRASDLRARDCIVETGVPYGSAAGWIVEEATLRHADLIVMGTHDRVGPDRWVHGSVAETVVSRAPVPVMLVRAADGARPVEHFDWRQPTLLVPLDGSEIAEAALPAAIALARSLNGRVVLVTVSTETSPSADDQGTRGYLESVVDQLTSAGVSVASLVRTGKPATEIAQAGREQNAAVVVMATHGRTGLARTVLGSVAGEVVHGSPSPVMLIRPAGLRVAEEPAVAQPTAAAAAI